MLRISSIKQNTWRHQSPCLFVPQLVCSHFFSYPAVSSVPHFLRCPHFQPICCRHPIFHRFPVALSRRLTPSFWVISVDLKTNLMSPYNPVTSWLSMFALHHLCTLVAARNRWASLYVRVDHPKRKKIIARLIAHIRKFTKKWHFFLITTNTMRSRVFVAAHFLFLMTLYLVQFYSWWKIFWQQTFSVN